MNIDWLTGFYEGEGTPNSGYDFALYIPQKGKAVLDLIQETFGGSVLEERVGPYAKEGYTNWQWRIYGKAAVELAYELLSHMHSPYKIEQLKQALIVSGHMEPRNEEEAEEARKKDVATKEYMRNYHQKSRMVRKYIREHPEIVAKLEEERNQ